LPTFQHTSGCAVKVVVLQRLVFNGTYSPGLVHQLSLQNIKIKDRTTVVTVHFVQTIGKK